ncbi:DUF3718 domain-containing protein [Aliidiomarina sanyensis]|uniref:DUF3718 domain-containing protein n=1 Tax=Aliidiomarina sanyensis TaxID=1249555 RepID=A0A432WCF4_9GAMM|nr:DUF3718 domain-containing protein [Aliidiomarina sanyensis]RUO30158.1 hypothetical protein CWE11_09380 [Aliidiomarina sanyensis]
MARSLVKGWIGLTAIVFASLTPSSQSLAQGEDIARAICYEISSDNLRELSAIINRHNLRLRNLYSSVRCNGYSMLQFAITAEAEDVGRMLTRSLPARMIQNDDVDGVPLLRWADATGYNSSPIVEAVRRRLGEI